MQNAATHFRSQGGVATSCQPHAGVVDWSVDDVCAFLSTVRLAEHADTFRAEDVDGNMLLQCQSDDGTLVELGLARGLERARLRSGIAKQLAAVHPAPVASTQPESDVDATADALASLRVHSPDDPRGLCLHGTDSLVGDGALMPAAIPHGPRDGGSWLWCSATSQWIEDGGMAISTDRVEQVREATLPVTPLRTAASPFRGEEAAPLASTSPSTAWSELSSRHRSAQASCVDSGVGGLNELLVSCDPLFHPGYLDRQDLYSDTSLPSEYDAYSLDGSGEAAPSRGLAWLRSAWRDIVEYHLVRGPRRRGESDYDLLTRVGFWHDDRFCEDGFGWVDAVDMGFTPGYLGGQVFQPMAPFLLDAAWARAAWQRALRGAQGQFIGARGQAWLALRTAERVQRAAFRAVRIERRISAGAWSSVRCERAGIVACAEAAYLRAARRSEAYSIELRVRADGARSGRHRSRRSRGRAGAGRG